MLRGVLDRIGEARLAVYSGNIAAASLIVSDIRSSLDIFQEPQIAGEIQIIEGLILAGHSIWDLSIDRFRRGAVIGRMIRSSDVSVFAETWLSHALLRVGRELEAMDILVRIVIDIPTARLEARHRFCTVAAELCAIAGERRRCENWFEISRGLANQIGSRGLFSASLFNLCMLRVWQNALLPRLQGGLDEESLRADLLLLESSVNYDSLTSVSDRSFLHDMLRGQLLDMIGRTDEAESIYQSLVESGVLCDQLGIYRIQLERIWCALRKSTSISSTSLTASCQSLLSAIAALVDEDDLAFAYSLLAKCYLSLGDLESSRQAQCSADGFLKKLCEKQDKIRMQLNSLEISL